MAFERQANKKTEKHKADVPSSGEASEGKVTPTAKPIGGEPARKNYERPRVKSVKDIRRIRELLEELGPDKLPSADE